MDEEVTNAEEDDEDAGEGEIVENVLFALYTPQT
jgi:hypothetical protein